MLDDKVWESDGIYSRILFYEDLGCFGEELGRLPIWGHISFLCKSWLNAESQVQFPFLAVDPTSVSIEFILPYWHFPEYNTLSLLCFLLSTFICSLRSKLHCWLSLFLFIWGVGKMRIELGDYFPTSRESSNKPKYFLWDLIGFLQSGCVWHCYWKWKFYS